MNYFNTVFSTLKTKCKAGDFVSDPSQLDDIATKTGITEDQLYFYLNCLDEMEVIHYTPATKTVVLTDIGKEVDSVFPVLVF